MAWDHLSVNRPHLVYIILGGFTSLFMLCSTFIKERLYIGEATVATICGVIFGPHAANLINPLTWGNTDQITLEFSRIVLVVQCFAVGVELPKYYMEKHWRSVVFLLIPVMTFGWLITAIFIWWMIGPLNWLESLCCAACVTATDPVLASSVVGKGKFAKRVPKHLRDLLSAESGCNDGMAFPFIYLALYLIQFNLKEHEVTKSWLCITILYECVFGAIYGFLVGYIGRHGIKYAEKHDLVDRESFLVFYFVLALFCAGSGSMLGVDDLLVGFAAGVGFSNDGWFTQKTEESHVSNVIDLLLNLAYFVYLGTIIPWEQYNNPTLSVTPWRLVIIALFVIFFRRIPIMMALKPFIPDIKTWREALFAGHFGPIGVGAIFVAILARAELETEGATPLASYPDPSSPNYTLVTLIWPITTFLVISSILVHGSSIAVFTLGKHINTLTLTMSYTTAHEEGPSWMNRLPRISSQSRSQAKSVASETDVDDLKMADNVPPGTLPPIGVPGHFLRRQKEEDNPSRAGSRASSLIPRRRKKKRDDVRPGGPVTESAIYPNRRSYSEKTTESQTLTPSDSSPPEEVETEKERRDSDRSDEQDDEIYEERAPQHQSDAERHPEATEVYDEGDHIIIENADGEVLRVEPSPEDHRDTIDFAKKFEEARTDIAATISESKHDGLKKMLGKWRMREKEPEAGESSRGSSHRTHAPALAYQFGNTIIVEDEDGEVVKTYELPTKPKAETDQPAGPVRQGIGRVGTWTGLAPKKPQDAASTRPHGPIHTESGVVQGITRMVTFGMGGKGGGGVEAARKEQEEAEDDDRRIRFTIGGGAGRRLTKDDFLKEMRALDAKTRSEVLEQSDAPAVMKDMAKKDADANVPGSNRLLGAQNSRMSTNTSGARRAAARLARQEGALVEDSQSEEEEEEEEEEESEDESPRGRRSSPGHAEPSASANDPPESAAERRRREEALKGVEDSPPLVSPSSTPPPSSAAVDSSPRGRAPGPSSHNAAAETRAQVEGETAAEKRRREAALGLSSNTGARGEEDSDDDDTPRVPPPVRSRGIRFAESPVRGMTRGSR